MPDRLTHTDTSTRQGTTSEFNCVIRNCDHPATWAVKLQHIVDVTSCTRPVWLTVCSEHHQLVRHVARNIQETLRSSITECRLCNHSPLTPEDFLMAVKPL